MIKIRSVILVLKIKYYIEFALLMFLLYIIRVLIAEVYRLSPLVLSLEHIINISSGYLATKELSELKS